MLVSGAETGASVAAYVDGRLVMDLWGGSALKGVPWQPDTLVHTYSVTKPFAAACLLKLVAQERVDLDQPVARYWPEYAAAGKDATTVRQVLSHQAGLIAWSSPQPVETLFDWDRATTLCAAETPWFRPGEGIGEALFLYGHVIGEIIRRVDGRSPGTFLAEELCGPRAIEFHIGLNESLRRRAADLVGMDGSWNAELLRDRTDLFARAMRNSPGVTNQAIVNSEAWRHAEVPAINGHGTARGVATFYESLRRPLPGDTALLSREVVAEAIRPQRQGPDLVLGQEVAWGLGFRVFEDGSFGMGGLGGAVGIANPKKGYSFGYVTNRVADHTRADLVEQALIRCVG